MPLEQPSQGHAARTDRLQNLAEAKTRESSPSTPHRQDCYEEARFMEAIHVSDWKSAILIISAGARKRPFPDFSGAPPQQPPANRSGYVRKGNNLCGRRRCAGRGHASLSERRASRSQTRCCFAASMYRPTLARASSSITPSSRSSAMAAFPNRGCALELWPMTLRCPKASRTQSIAALFLRSGLIPSAEAKIATASKKTEGSPDSAISVAKCFPDLR